MSSAAVAFASTDRLEKVDVVEDAAPAPELEQERRVAIYDLVEENRFRLRGAAGPYALTVERGENSGRGEASDAGYSFVVRASDGVERQVHVADPALDEASLEYLALCEAYREAVRRLPPSQIEAADAERRALHDEASELLRSALAAEVEIDGQTARRLFTLCCSLGSGMEKLL
ncbi:MAG: UPF0262 family protein [Neomegalonema sp.]|nr:UPF0262 family protein [Neomegalonema sp.]